MKAAKCLEEKGVPERDGGRRQRYNAFFGREKKKKRKKKRSSPFVVFVPFTPTIILVAPAQDCVIRPAYKVQRINYNTLDDTFYENLFRVPFFHFSFFFSFFLIIFSYFFYFSFILFLFSFVHIGQKECIESIYNHEILDGSITVLHRYS